MLAHCNLAGFHSDGQTLPPGRIRRLARRRGYNIPFICFRANAVAAAGARFGRMTRMPAAARREPAPAPARAPDSAVEVASAGGVAPDQLEKFWNELSPQERRNLLQIDKQVLIEEARKSLCCSRCTSSLVESFSDISMQGKQEENHGNIQDPSIHHWGCLTTTKDGALTVLDCFFEEKSLLELRKVFEFGRSRERERESLYPNACGGGKRGWISQVVAMNGKGNGVRETCAFHTSKIPCEALVDYWSGLTDESRQSLLTMEEEDFVAKLTFRSKDKTFCPHCRKGFMREFKEVKELKRVHQKPSCTNWFCTPDTRFRCEVTDTTIRAEWHRSFTDGIRSFCRFEWCVGTAEGKSDIMEFVDVGMDESAVVHGLNLRDIDACYITLRAWKENGKYREFFVKAHALKGKQCIHRRIMFGDKLVSITTGGSISDFFEQAEEVEDEEDDILAKRYDKDLDKDGPHFEKHAKDVEEARGFLLGIATVVFKQKVEREFREVAARQNARFTFVGLALKLLEERVHVACKEIITVKRQKQLLEEEDKEKREAEERSEKKKAKQREKKLRQKDQVSGKENVNEESEELLAGQESESETLLGTHKQCLAHFGDAASKAGEDELSSLDKDEEPFRSSSMGQEKSAENLLHSPLHDDTNVNLGSMDDYGFMMTEKAKAFRRKPRAQNELSPDLALDHGDRKQSSTGNCINPYAENCQAKSNLSESTYRPMNALQRNLKSNVPKLNLQGCGVKLGEKSESWKHISRSWKAEGGSDVGSVNPERYPRANVPLDSQFCDSNGSFVSYSDPRTGICHNLVREQNRWESWDVERIKPKSTSHVDVAVQASGVEKRLPNSGYACSASGGCNSKLSANDVQTVESVTLHRQDYGMAFSMSPSLTFRGCHNNDYVYREKNCVQNILTRPARGSVSVDNVSPRLRDESFIGSSVARPAEYLCRSDSEDSSHLSESKDISPKSEAHKNAENMLYLNGLPSVATLQGQNSRYEHGIPKNMSDSPHTPPYSTQSSDSPVSTLMFPRFSSSTRGAINNGMLEHESRSQGSEFDANIPHAGPLSHTFSDGWNGQNFKPILAAKNSPVVQYSREPFSYFHFGGPIDRPRKDGISVAEGVNYRSYYGARQYSLF